MENKFKKIFMILGWLVLLLTFVYISFFAEKGFVMSYPVSWYIGNFVLFLGMGAMFTAVMLRHLE